MGFSMQIISPDKDRTKLLVFSNEKDFKTDVFKAVVERVSTFTYDDISALQKTIDNLEFKEDTNYTVFGLSFTTEKFV